MPPELVDETTLLFQLPQRAGLMPSQILALNNSPYMDAVTAGALGHTLGHGGFLLAQPSPFVPRDNMVQIGWGAAWQAIRFGLAARASRLVAESTSSAETYTSFSSLENEILEGSCSVSARRSPPSTTSVREWKA